MLISFFKKSFIPQYAALIFIHGMLWLPAFLSPGTFQQPFSIDEAPGNQLLQWLFGGHPLIAISFAFFLVLFSGYLLNYTLITYGLAAKNSLLTALVFYLLAAHQPWLLQLHPGLIPGFILILAIYLLFDLYVEQEAYSQVFNTGFLLAISSLFYFPMIYFVVMVFFTFVVYRLFKWREWVIFLLGIITVYLLTFTACFWFDVLPSMFSWLVSDAMALRFIQLPRILPLGYVVDGLLIVLFFMAFFISGSHLNEKIISIRKRFWAVIWVFIITAVSFLFSGNQATTHIFLLMLPLCIIFSFYLSEIKKTFWANMLILLLFFLILFNSFHFFIQNQSL